MKSKKLKDTQLMKENSIITIVGYGNKCFYMGKYKTLSENSHIFGY